MTPTQLTELSQRRTLTQPEVVRELAEWALRALDIIESFQWDEYGMCPNCQQIVTDGHDSDCPLAALLKESP